MDEVMPKKKDTGEESQMDVSDIAVDIDKFLTKIRWSENSAGNINPALFVVVNPKVASFNWTRL